MADKKKKGMTRAEAAELYEALRKGMQKRKTAGHENKVRTSMSDQEVAKQIAMSIKAAMAKEDGTVERQAPSGSAPGASSVPPRLLQRELPSSPLGHSGSGRMFAVALVLFFALAKIGVAALENFGLGIVEPVAAAQVQSTDIVSKGGFSRAELELLRSLDSRRATLEKRAHKIKSQENELEERDREFAMRLTELREMTERLKVERERDVRKRDAQLDQLANVYGSMNPKEAADLMQQLDVTIALELIERMPEKRIGQILALMTPERALSITRMMSERPGLN